MYLKLNSRGEDVKSVKEILKQLGFTPGPADCVYGEKTEDTVTRFQEQYNLYADGIVGPNTWRSLNQALKIHVEEQVLPENVKGVSTFGDELLKVYNREELISTPPWEFRDRVLGLVGFNNPHADKCV